MEKGNGFEEANEILPGGVEANNGSGYIDKPPNRIKTLTDEVPEESREDFDPVDRPEHYAKGTLECIDWIRCEMTREEYRGYLKGNMLKYIWRHEDKGNPVQDLEKVRKYAEFLIDDYEREECEGPEW